MDRDPRNANDSFDPTPAPDGFPEGRCSTDRNPAQLDLDTEETQTGERHGRIKDAPDDPEANVPRESK
ncbi:MAG: hypothetical protein KGM17_14380 [Sphingomonadales bacterium]|nr:hypothetical protein [Sphingomonadales bacterium]